MALNSSHFFFVYTISPKSNRVAHPDSCMLGETLHQWEILNSKKTHINIEGGMLCSITHVHLHVHVLPLQLIILVLTMHVATITCRIVHVPVRCHGDVDDGDGGGGVSWSVSYRADHHYCTCRKLQHTDGNIKMDFRNLLSTIREESFVLLK